MAAVFFLFTFAKSLFSNNLFFLAVFLLKNDPDNSRYIFQVAQTIMFVTVQKTTLLIPKFLKVQGLKVQSEILLPK